MSTQHAKGSTPPPINPPPKNSFADAAKAAAQAGATGFENSSDKDFQIPYLAIIQKGSPQLDKNAPEFIKGAETGDIVNTSTGRVYKVFGDGSEVLEVIPCGFQPAYVEWKLRSQGGGFVRTHTTPPPSKKGNDQGKLDPNGRFDLTSPGTHVVETKYHSVIVKDGEDWYPAVIALASTQLKKSRKWMSQMQARKVVASDGTTFNPPTFANRYKITTAPESNNFGDWYGWVFTFLGEPDEAIFERAFAAHKSFIATPQLPAPPSSAGADEPEAF